METLLINALIIVFAIFIWMTNHYYESRDLVAIEKEIEEELEKDD